MPKVERDTTEARFRRRALHPVTVSIAGMALFVCVVWGACSMITWAVTNLPVWFIALVAVAFIAVFTAAETRS